VSAHKSVAVLGVIDRAEEMHSILDVETTPGTARVMVGNTPRPDTSPIDIALPKSEGGGGCWAGLARRWLRPR